MPLAPCYLAVQLATREHGKAYKVLKRTTFVAHAFPVRDNGYIRPRVMP